jgi:DNA-binding transcriptional regulator YiaG
MPPTHARSGVRDFLHFVCPLELFPGHSPVIDNDDMNNHFVMVSFQLPSFQEESILPAMPPDHQQHRYTERVALGARLKHWRLGENRKMSEVAALLGVSTGTWGHWETGERLPSGELLLAIQNLTGLPLRVLFCPHLDNCPQIGSGKTPRMDQPCCQCAPRPAAPDNG